MMEDWVALFDFNLQNFQIAYPMQLKLLGTWVSRLGFDEGLRLGYNINILMNT